MDPQLKARAQKVAALRDSREGFTEAQINEVAAVHHLLTGSTTDCNQCNVYGFINTINSILTKEPLIIKNMATAKGQFKHGAGANRIIRHTEHGTIVINADNLNQGDNFAFAAKEYPHLVEEAKAPKTEEPAKTETKTAPKK